MDGVLDLWQERAAIMEYDAGLSRFEAESRAAECYGTTRHQMMTEMRNADGYGPAGGHGRDASPLDGKRDADGLPGMQRQSGEENGPVSERQPEAGRDSDPLLALRPRGRGAV